MSATQAWRSAPWTRSISLPPSVASRGRSARTTPGFAPLQPSSGFHSRPFRRSVEATPLKTSRRIPREGSSMSVWLPSPPHSLSRSLLDRTDLLHGFYMEHRSSENTKAPELFRSGALRWLRESDLNRRPLGYELPWGPVPGLGRLGLHYRAAAIPRRRTQVVVCDSSRRVDRLRL